MVEFLRGIAFAARLAGIACSVVFSFGAIAFAAKFPNGAVWNEGQPLVLALIVTGVITAAYQSFANVDLGRRRRRALLDDACQQMAAYLDDKCSRIPLRSIGVHIWRVRGISRWKHLSRAGQFLLRRRASSDVVWRRKKGAIGAAWDEKCEILIDLETELYPLTTTKEATEALPPKERLYLEWDEIKRTSKYKAIYATPLKRRRVRGVLAIDVLTPGHFDEFRKATFENQDFNSILGVCQDALWA